MNEKQLVKYLLLKQTPKPQIRNIILRFREKFNNLNPKESFNDYVKIMFSETVASCDFQESQHTRALIEILQLRADKKLLNNNLIISIPPGHTKTLLCNILYCSWILGKYPHLRQLLGTNSQTEGNKRNLELRDLMQSDKYKKIFPDVFLTGEDVKWLKTNHKGGRLAVTTDVAMRFTGTDADELIIDDPNDTTSTLIEFEKVKDWFDKKAKRRLRRGNLGFLCIMQRVGLQDLTEHLLKSQQDILHIVLPAESINDYSLSLPLKDGSIHQINISQGYLWNDKDIIKMYEDAKKNQLVWQTQYQQNPSEATGIYFKPYHFEGLTPLENIINEVGYYYISVDPASSGNESSDFTGIAVMKYSPIKKKAYLQDIISFKPNSNDIAKSWDQTIRLIVSLFKRYNTETTTCKILVEINGVGAGLPNGLIERGIAPKMIETIKRTSSTRNKESVNVKNLKESMALEIAIKIEHGTLILPRVEDLSGMYNFRNQLLAFPNGKNDDMIDAVSNCLYHLNETGKFGIIQKLN